MIVNNTALGGSEMGALPKTQDPDGWPEHSWLMVEGSNNVVRNNLVTSDLSGGDHNLEVAVGGLDTVFADWAGLDLHLAAGSPAIDAGSWDEAPEDDLDGQARSGQPDVGAYEWVE